MRLFLALDDKPGAEDRFPTPSGLCLPTMGEQSGGKWNLTHIAKNTNTYFKKYI